MPLPYPTRIKNGSFRPMPVFSAEDVIRFSSFVNKTGDCWLWMGSQQAFYWWIWLVSHCWLWAPWRS